MNRTKQEFENGKTPKLVLSRETLRILEDHKLREVAGGPTEGTCATEVTVRCTGCTCAADL